MSIQQTIKPISLRDINEQAARVASVLDQVKAAMLAPHSKKQPPRLKSAEIISLCGIDKNKFTYAQSRGDLPPGLLVGSRLEWTLQEVRVWAKHFRSKFLRPSQGASAVTITVSNFKGGVAKTTSAVSLAQGLALKGHKVLIIDLDPQGSATSLFGFLPDADVEPEQTCIDLFSGEQDSIDSAIRPTYWDGIDLVCAGPMLFSAEFSLPARQAKDPGFEFWKVLDHGLENAREIYDVIIIDTPPALSYTTINALLASDGVIIPLPPSAMDFSSSSQFWSLFSDLCNNLEAKDKTNSKPKTFEFINILLSRVETNEMASNVVRQWIIEAYGNKVLPIEIPKTTASTSASAEFGTVYDIDKNNTALSPKTYARARNAYDRYCDLIEDQISAVWLKQVESNKPHVTKK